jgi:hypothetical protein
MDITTRVFKRQLINTDTVTGLDRYAEIIDIIMTGKDGGMITIKGRVALLSPNLQCVEVESEFEFKRYDKPAVTADVLVVDSPAIIVNDEIVTPEVGHYESQVVTAANNKFTYLEQSPIGLGIKQMLGADLAGAIVDELWVPANLNML